MMNAAKSTVKQKLSMRSSLAAPPQSIKLGDGLTERISKKAFELWQDRGCRDGHDLADWLDAETIVMDRAHEARV
jgi:Protein of unknown function (DUF2934)